MKHSLPDSKLFKQLLKQKISIQEYLDKLFDLAAEKNENYKT